MAVCPCSLARRFTRSTVAAIRLSMSIRGVTGMDEAL
jgi:hypothetical protein